MLIAIYAVLKSDYPFRDPRFDYYNQFDRKREIAAYLKKLKALGWEQSAAIAPARVCFITA